MRWLVGLPLVFSLGACALIQPKAAGQGFPVFFQPTSAALANGADAVVDQAAKFANAHSSEPVILAAYAAPPGHHYVEPDGVDTQRAQAVTARLVADGVDPARIVVKPRGQIQPEVPMSKIEVRRVDIIVGTPGN